MSSYGISHKGYVRSENEDAYCIEDRAIGNLANLYVVADGMGGHRGGAVASRMAVDHVFGFIQSATSNVEDTITESILHANRAIFTRAVEDGSLFGMGTTIEALTITEEAILIGHIGDSRIYLWEDNLMKQLTKDHSYVQELVDAGVINEYEALTHPNKNRITRALGVDKDVVVDSITIQRNSSKMTLLMCSDGLTNMISDDWINSVVCQELSLKERCYKLLEEALDNGGKDNITLILLEIEGRD